MGFPVNVGLELVSSEPLETCLGDPFLDRRISHALPEDAAFFLETSSS